MPTEASSSSQDHAPAAGEMRGTTASQPERGAALSPSEVPGFMARGYRWWDAEHTLLLVPLADLDNIPDGTVLGCIDGSTVKKGFDPIDTDTRGGLLAYGYLVAA